MPAVVVIPVDPPPQRRVTLGNLAGYVWDHVCGACAPAQAIPLVQQSQASVHEPLDPALDHSFQAVPVLDD